MVANILIVLFIVAWVFGVVFMMIKRRNKAKKEGVPLSCCGCSVSGTSECHCSK